jgi:peptidoglycan hydrolase-like protein with peptidoglycan-binding domain
VREEVTEVQTRLRSFGLDPGPIDGAAGPMTEDAVRRYQQARGQTGTGTIDRELLVQLRYDPAPQLAPPQPAPTQGTQRASRRPAAAQAARPPARSSDPFEPLRTAGNQFSQWLHSLTR